METLVSILNAHQPGIVPFEKCRLFEMWRKVLFNQFHDILPGSAIPDVYLQAFQELQGAIDYAEKTVQQCLALVPSAPGSHNFQSLRVVAFGVLQLQE